MWGSDEEDSSDEDEAKSNEEKSIEDQERKEIEAVYQYMASQRSTGQGADHTDQESNSGKLTSVERKMSTKQDIFVFFIHCWMC